MYVVWVYMEAKSSRLDDTPKTTLVTTRLSDAQAVELERRALLADRTIAAELRRAVRFYLEQVDGEVAA